MTSLLALLEDLVVAEFDAGDLKNAKQRALPPDADAPPVEVVRSFLDALAVVQKKRPQQVYVWAGDRLTAQVLKATPAVTSGHTSLQTILLQLNLLIPKVVDGLVPGVVYPEFWGDLMGGDVVRVGFDGDEEVAWLLEGAVKALAVHFREQVDISRGFAKASLKQRRLVDVWATPKRNSGRFSAVSGVSSPGVRS